jgi:predicted RNase H-like HicB family nuclease
LPKSHWANRNAPPAAQTLRHSPVLESNRRFHLQHHFDVVVERDEEGYYLASVPALPGCHTQAKSLDELNERIREAIQLCLEVEGVPEHSLEFVGIQRITIAA